jgi:uncharacterized protein with ATP-grasp and redox domains
MKTYLDCIPCFVRQTLDAVRRVTDDEAVHERLLREILRAASTLDPQQPPPAMGQRIHRRIRQLTGQRDPYLAAKDRFNRLALAYLPDLQARVAASPAPLETAARLAIAGNVIDMGVHGALTDAQVQDAVDRALSAPLCGSVDCLARAVAEADRILYLADNAGELVFDRLLLEQLPLDRVTLAVRGAPVINDATVEDARVAGVHTLVKVIDNGSDAPGTILEDCSAAFRQRFEAADLVIAKGQGNYETLSHVQKNIVFALMAKCPVIARDLNCPVGSMVLRPADALTPASDEEAATRRLPDRVGQVSDL